MKKIIVLLLCFCQIFLYGTVAYGSTTTDTSSDTTKSSTDNTVALTEEEKAYIAKKGTIKMVIDPDWYPYEELDSKGEYSGISADLTALIAKRTGLQFEVVPTSNWEESMELANSGEADVISFLNKTEERSKWLWFTEPYFTDPNVFITREEHDYITSLARISDETVVLPEGTSVEEKLREDYPNIKIILVKSEEEAISYVEDKKADLTLRSLTMSAYIIKSEGYFNLKIAGEISSYSNKLRMGITKNDPILKSILNKGIASISEEEVQEAINNHISINIVKGFDYKIFVIISGVFAFILLSSFLWLRRIQRLNRNLKQRQEEILRVSEQLSFSEKKFRKIAEELEVKNRLLEVTATIDSMTGLKNRYSFDLRLAEELERAKRYGTELSLLLMDIDHFKRINDTYGHNAGDEVICLLAKTLQNNLRKVDMMARWGGEEFIVLLPEIGLEDAVLVGEKLREAAEDIVHLGKEKVTISLGASTWTEEDTIESWFNRTDKAQYRAKQEGRNRVCVSRGIENLSKEFLRWKAEWESGNEVIDQQHKDLVSGSNELITASLLEENGEKILARLKFLLEEIQTHFSKEEEILSKVKYEGLEMHTESHHQLLEKAAELLKKAEEGKLLPSDVIQFLVGDVVNRHMIQEDTRFFNLFQEKSI